MFTFHISERTLRYLLRDPVFSAINDPSFADMRDALLRLEAMEDKPIPQKGLERVTLEASRA